MTEIFDDTAIDSLLSAFGEESVKSVLLEGDFTRYQQNPIGFFKDVLGIKNVPDDLVKIAESVRDNKVTVCQSATGVGKTYIAAAVSCWWYKCFSQSQVIATAAPPEENIKSKLFSEIYDFVVANKKIFKNDKILTLKITDDVSFKGDSEEEGSNKHFILGKTIPTSGSEEERESKFSGSHAPFLLFINDEADAIPDEVFRGEDGCLSSDGSRQLNLYNPKRRSGWIYNVVKSGKANVVVLSAFNHPNVITGENLIPGAVSRDKTVERIYDWSTPLKEGEEPDSSCFEVPEFLVGCTAMSPSGQEYPALTAGWRRITNSAFYYKCLGIYPAATENSLISETDIDNAMTRWKLYKAQYGKQATEGIRPILGMDVADEGSDNCCVAKKYGNFIDEFDGYCMWRGVDVDISADKLGKLYAQLDAQQVNVESDGIGAAIPPKVSRMFYWRCMNSECSNFGKTFEDQHIFNCPICQKEMVRQHYTVKKVYVSAPSDKKCDIGKFGTVRDELAWKVAEWLKKDPGAMIPPDPELKEQMLAYEYGEDQNSGRIKVSDKRTVRKKISGNSDDKFAALRQCFFEAVVPKVRVV